MIKGFHSNWSKPFFVDNKKNYFIEDYDILTTILSALKWRQHNGPIKMITDETCAQYYKYLNIEDIWDLGIEVKLNNISSKIDEEVFWAAGKIYALQSEKAPVAMIDTDFIVWDSIEEILKNKDICVIHREGINEDVYPSKDYFKFNEGYKLNSFYDWNEKPCNTAFLYISNNDFKDYYTNESINFMKNVINNKDRIKYMVFAEQRLISMCAKYKGFYISELMNLRELSLERQKLFTHVWGYKSVMKNNYKLRENFCTRCLKRIIEDFPQYEEKLANIKEFNRYFMNLGKGRN